MISVVRLVVVASLLLGAAALPGGAAGPVVLSVEAAQAFRSVGRLNIAGKRFCTATLIEASIVVTAAHCLFDPRTRRQVSIQSMHFVAGLNRGGYVAARRVVRAALLPEYRYDDEVNGARVSADVALLELMEPIPSSVAVPERTAGAGPESTLTLISYSRQRPHAPSREAGGAVLWREGRMMVLDFKVSFGASGAPVFAERDGERSLLGIVSASARVQGKPVALSVMTGDPIQRLLRKLRPSG